MLIDVHQGTPIGRLKRAAPVEVRKLIVNAWSMVGTNVVAKSFKVIGISNKLDGIEDSFVQESEQEASQSCQDGDTSSDN